MSFLDFLQSVATGQTQTNPLLQRVAQQAVAAQHPTFAGHDVSGVPVLSGAIQPAVEALNTSGLIGEGAQQVAEAATGAGLAANARLNPFMRLLPDAPGSQLAERAATAYGNAGGGPGGALAANEAARQSNGLITTLLNMETNPLNLAGPVGEAGAGLRALEGAPAALRGLGAALEGAGVVGRAGTLPYEGGFGAVGGLFKGIKNAVLPAAEKETIPALLAAADSGTAALPAALTAPAAPTFSKATMNLLATKGIDPAKLAGLDADMAQYVAEHAQLGQEEGLIAQLRGAVPSGAAEAAPAATAPAGAIKALETPPPATTPEIAPVAPEPAAGLDYGDRAGVVKAVANAPVSHLNAVLADLHNAIYPGQQADFAIPALTGQARQEFRTSFLTDHPSGNAAEPYLDYLLNRVQKDPKAAARLAEANPLLADDIALLAESDLPLTEHKRLVQALFGVGPEGGAEVAPAVSAMTDNAAATATDPLAAMRDLIRAEAARVNTVYPPNDPAFYAKRLGIPEGDVPDLLGQLEQSGFLGRDQTGALAVKPAPKALGGDIAAGGGGFGLLPPGGLLPAAAARALVGGGVGATAGAIIPTDNPHDRLRNAALGGVAGAGVGAGLPGIRRDVIDPLLALHTEGLASTGSSVATGEKNPIPALANMLPYVRSIKKTSPMAVPRNLTGALGTVAIGEGDVLQAARNMRDIWRNLPTLLPDLRAAGTDAAARDAALFKALPTAMQSYDRTGMQDLIEAAGVNYERNPTDIGAANVHPLAGAVRGTALALASPRTLVMGPASLALGAAEGATLPYRSAVQVAALTPIDQGARLAFAFPDYARALGEAAPGFLARVKATGQDIAALATGGRFAATDIADPALAAEWRATQQRAAQVGGALAKDRLGNFSDPKAATGLINNLFPGGSWNVEQIKVLARAAARHPMAAIGILHTMRQDYDNHVASGDPQHAGTWRVTDTTPGLGALVRLANGGAPGERFVNPLYPISPISSEALNLPRELSPYYHPGMKPYDQAKAVAGALGFGVNPEIDLGAYKAGQSQSAPSSQVRLAPVGAFADALLHERGAPLWENPIGQALTPDALQQPDLTQQLQHGRYVDPAAIRAGNELIYEQRGTSSSDPKNVDLVAQLRDPSSAFYHQALVRGLGSQAATGVLSDVIPGGAPGQSTTAAGEAKALFALMQQGPGTKAQLAAIAADPHAGQLLSQLWAARLQAAKLQDPLLAVQDLATPQALGQKVLDQWKRDFQGLTAFPAVYEQQAALEQERLGLLPLGTAAQAQTLQSQQQAGQVYGRPGPYPGMPPVPFDPTPLYDLMHYLNGGR